MEKEWNHFRHPFRYEGAKKEEKKLQFKFFFLQLHHLKEMIDSNFIIIVIFRLYNTLTIIFPYFFKKKKKKKEILNLDYHRE